MQPRSAHLLPAYFSLLFLRMSSGHVLVVVRQMIAKGLGTLNPGFIRIVAGREYRKQHDRVRLQEDQIGDR